MTYDWDGTRARRARALKLLATVFFVAMIGLFGVLASVVQAADKQAMYRHQE